MICKKNSQNAISKEFLTTSYANSKVICSKLLDSRSRLSVNNNEIVLLNTFNLQSRSKIVIKKYNTSCKKHIDDNNIFLGVKKA